MRRFACGNDRELVTHKAECPRRRKRPFEAAGVADGFFRTLGRRRGSAFVELDVLSKARSLAEIRRERRDEIGNALQRQAADGVAEDRVDAADVLDLHNDDVVAGFSGDQLIGVGHQGVEIKKARQMVDQGLGLRQRQAGDQHRRRDRDGRNISVRTDQVDQYTGQSQE